MGGIQQQRHVASFRCKVKPYSGAEAEDVDAFIYDLKQAFEARGVPEADRILFVSEYLTGPAKVWFRTNRARIDDWNEFEQDIRNEFADPYQEFNKIAELFTVKQVTTVLDYVARFRSFARYYSELPDIWQVYVFQLGLKEATKRDLRIRQPETLDEAIQFSIAFDKASFANIGSVKGLGFKGKLQKPRPPKPYQNKDKASFSPSAASTASEFTGIEPMDIGSVKVKCHMCKQWGHYRRDCPQEKKKWPKSKRSGKKVNCIQVKASSLLIPT
jgi:hypothetical protein